MATGFTVLVLTGCSASDLESDLTEVSGTGFGWGHGECMVFDGPDVSSGDEIAVVGVIGRHRLARATVGEKVVSSENCYPLLEDRKEVNTSSGNAFYLIKGIPKESAFGLSIGLAGNRPDLVVDQGVASADVDGDGYRDTLGQCSTSEGVRFFIASGKSGATGNIWEGYYYLGYDSEVTCP